MSRSASPEHFHKNCSSCCDLRPDICGSLFCCCLTRRTWVLGISDGHGKPGVASRRCFIHTGICCDAWHVPEMRRESPAQTWKRGPSGTKQKVSDSSWVASGAEGRLVPKRLRGPSDWQPGGLCREDTDRASSRQKNMYTTKLGTCIMGYGSP